MTNLSTYWNEVYQKKSPHERSWTQDLPLHSLELIHSLPLSKDAPVIDIGGGDSRLVDALLDEGFTNLTVLDIAETAIQAAKERLGERAGKVQWIVSDINTFEPEQDYALWHDRATFHFLTEEKDIRHYKQIVKEHVNGYLLIGTFSPAGPAKCSGLPVQRYDTAAMKAVWNHLFCAEECREKIHETPFHTKQPFTFCVLKRCGESA